MYCSSLSSPLLDNKVPLFLLDMGLHPGPKVTSMSGVFGSSLSFVPLSSVSLRTFLSVEELNGSAPGSKRTTFFALPCSFWPESAPCATLDLAAPL